MNEHTLWALNRRIPLLCKLTILLAALLCIAAFPNHAEANPRAGKPAQAASPDIQLVQFRNRGWGRTPSYAPTPRYNAPTQRFSPNRQRYDQLRANQQQRFRTFQAARLRHNELVVQRRQRIQALQQRQLKLNAQRLQRANDQKRLQDQKLQADVKRDQDQKSLSSSNQTAAMPSSGPSSGNLPTLSPRLQSRLNRVSAKALTPRLSAGGTPTGASSGSSGNGSRPPEAGTSGSSGNNSHPPGSGSGNGVANTQGGGTSGGGGSATPPTGNLTSTFNRSASPSSKPEAQAPRPTLGSDLAIGTKNRLRSIFDGSANASQQATDGSVSSPSSSVQTIQQKDSGLSSKNIPPMRREFERVAPPGGPSTDNPSQPPSRRDGGDDRKQQMPGPTLPKPSI